MPRHEVSPLGRHEVSPLGPLQLVRYRYVRGSRHSCSLFPVPCSLVSPTNQSFPNVGAALRREASPLGRRPPGTTKRNVQDGRLQSVSRASRARDGAPTTGFLLPDKSGSYKTTEHSTTRPPFPGKRRAGCFLACDCPRCREVSAGRGLITAVRCRNTPSKSVADHLHPRWAACAPRHPCGS